MRRMEMRTVFVVLWLATQIGIIGEDLVTRWLERRRKDGARWLRTGKTS